MIKTQIPFCLSVLGMTDAATGTDFIQCFGANIELKGTTRMHIINDKNRDFPVVNWLLEAISPSVVSRQIT